MSLREEGIKDVIIVHMFGSFSMDYNGKLITGKSKNSESQFNYMMQLLLHEGSKGVTKNTLISTLFANRDVNNMNHAIHSVIYNAKKRLEEYGLPKENYIIQKEGVFYWNGTTPIKEDAREFEALIAQAKAEEDKDKKIELYLSALHLYAGDFLEGQVSVAWIARENWRYRQLFTKAVNDLAVLLREKGKYDALEDIGKLATHVQPFSNWETLTMEALVNSGQYEKAMKLYEETVDLYMYEQGIKPSNKMFELVNELGSQFEHNIGILEDIRNDLKEEEEGHGGYLCSYPVFMGIYQSINRITERSGQTAYLMLCTIIDTKGNALTKGSNLEELSNRLESAIQTTIRRSDIMNKYSKSQYLVLLLNTTMENCEIIKKRINEKFMINRQQISVSYYVSSIW